MEWNRRPWRPSCSIAFARAINLTTALHKLAVVQGRWDPRARAYLERRQAEGKTGLEALRCLKRLLARVVFRLLRQTPTRHRERVVKVRSGTVRVAALA